MFAYADGFDAVLYRINANIINPAIEFAFIIAFVIFIWGVFQFIAGAGDVTKRQLGKDHMLWGLVGFLIMFGVYGLITILANTIGVTGLTLSQKQQTFTPPQIQTVNVPK
jgi:predicted cobalt transporter CbtA